MSIAVLLSVQSKWCQEIADGKKTVEIRKTKPALAPPFKARKVYIYCTKAKPDIGKFHEGAQYMFNGNVIGEFVCREISMIDKRGINNNFDYCYLSLNEFGNDDIETKITAVKKSRIPKEELNSYGKNAHYLYAWHISDLVVYDKPKALNEFVGLRKTRFGYEPNKITRPPQSWCYVEESADA